MDEIELTKENKKRIIREIGRLSKEINSTQCIGCANSLGYVVNILAGILAKKITIKQFLEKIAEGNAGPKVIQFYLDMFEV